MPFLRAGRLACVLCFWTAGWPQGARTGDEPVPESGTASLVRRALEAERAGALPGEHVLVPARPVAPFTGVRWPYSNSASVLYSVLGLLYGRTPAENDAGELVNDDQEYSVQNILSGETFCLFYRPPDDSLSLAAYGLRAVALEPETLSPSERTALIRHLAAEGAATVLRDGEQNRTFLVLGYREGGGAPLGCRFADGDDELNSSFDLYNPQPLPEDALSAPEWIAYFPDGAARPRPELFREALSRGADLLLLDDPVPGMDLARCRGAGAPLYRAWTRQLLEAGGREDDTYYFTGPVFPHFAAQHENFIHLAKFMAALNAAVGDDHLQEAGERAERMRQSTESMARATFREWSQPELLAMDPDGRRAWLADRLEAFRGEQEEWIRAVRAFLRGPRDP